LSKFNIQGAHDMRRNKGIGRFACSMIVVASALASGRVDAQEPSQPGQGLALAQQVCAACHAIDKRTEASPNPAAPRFEVIANVPGMTTMALTVALRTPHKTMPNLVLEGEEIRNVAAYILSLK
jgi:mono/diheme cytochrome c family protein